MSNYSFSVQRQGSFQDTIEQVTDALRDEGFGVLTDIDVAATLKAKLGIDTKPYRILGACNPQLAHRAIEAEPDIGALLPCNVVVRDGAPGCVDVVFMDPASVLGLVSKPGLEPIAKEVRERLVRVSEKLRD